MEMETKTITSTKNPEKKIFQGKAIKQNNEKKSEDKAVAEKAYPKAVKQNNEKKPEDKVYQKEVIKCNDEKKPEDKTYQKEVTKCNDEKKPENETYQEVAKHNDEEHPDNEQFTKEDSGSEDENENEHKFSSPATGIERLSKLPSDVLYGLQILSIETTFNLFIEEIQNRCHEYKNTHDRFSFERMWVQTVFGRCMDFRREHFHTKVMLNRVPIEITNFMKNNSLIDLLQIFIDLSQQNGYHAKLAFDTLKNNTSRRVTQRELDDAYNGCVASQKLYHDFVDLYRHCIGTWRPSRTTYHNRDQRSLKNDHQEKSRNIEKKSERRKYKPGSYPISDDHHPITSQMDNRTQRYEKNNREIQRNSTNPKQFT